MFLRRHQCGRRTGVSRHSSSSTTITISDRVTARPHLWRAEHARQPRAQRPGAQRRLECLPKPLICDHERIVWRRTRMRQAVADWNFLELGLVRREQVVPDQQHAAKIFVDVFRVAGVMHAMCRRRVDDPLQPADPRHELGVDEELISQAGRYHAVNPARVITDPHDRQIEEENPRQDRGPRQPEGSGCLHLLAAVMDAVRRPQEPASMGAAMLDVKAEVDQQEQNDQAAPVVERHRNGRQPDLINGCRDDAQE